MHRLIVNPGTAFAWELNLKPGVNTLGRDPSSQIHISHHSVSGSHCEITVTDDAVIIKDLGSTNGTFVSDVQVREAVLKPGQTIHLGTVELIFDPPTPEKPPEAAQ